jgi:nucleotide-binding universal stress UspA family protein
MRTKTDNQQLVPRSATKRKGTSAKVMALTLRRILVPIDFSGKSRQALEIAVPLAKQYGGRIFLVHVAQPPAVSAWQLIPGGEHYLTMDISNIIGPARKELEALAVRRVPVELRGRTLVREGNPYSEITSAARRLKADLIVISTHGHTGMRRMLIGSVAERVVRHAPCAVLTVRRH